MAAETEDIITEALQLGLVGLEVQPRIGNSTLCEGSRLGSDSRAEEEAVCISAAQTCGGNELFDLGTLLLQKFELPIESDLCCRRVLLERAELVGPLRYLVVTLLNLHERLLPQPKQLLALLVDAAEVLSGLGRGDLVEW